MAETARLLAANSTMWPPQPLARRHARGRPIRNMAETATRVDFANSLRGLAAISVLVSHYIGGFWLTRGGIANVIFAPVLPAETLTPDLSYALFSIYPIVDWGVLGVAIFFLVSGFVIPFSLLKNTGLSFAANRLFRIVPTYVAGFSFTILALWLSINYWQLEWPFSTSEVLIHAIPGLRGLCQSRPIDYVVWTLEIELKFYLVCAIAIGWFRTGSLRVFWIPCAMFVFFFTCNRTPASTPYIGWIAFNGGLPASCLVYMFIGVLFHYVHRGLIEWQNALLGICAIFAAFCFLTYETSNWSECPVVWSYGIAVLAFLFATANPGLFQSNRVFVFLADISYPLYVVHGVLGFTVLRILADRGVPAYLALAICTALVVMISWGLHICVEVPSQTLGKILSSRLASQRNYSPLR